MQKHINYEELVLIYLTYYRTKSLYKFIVDWCFANSLQVMYFYFVDYGFVCLPLPLWRRSLVVSKIVSITFSSYTAEILW